MYYLTLFIFEVLYCSITKDIILLYFNMMRRKGVPRRTKLTVKQLAEAKDLFFDKNLPSVPKEARADIDLNKVQEQEAEALWRQREHFGTDESVTVVPTSKKRSYSCSSCKKPGHSKVSCPDLAKKARKRRSTQRPVRKKQRKTPEAVPNPVPESEGEAESEAEATPDEKYDIFAEFEAWKKKQENYMAKMMGLNMMFQAKLKSYQKSMT